MYTGFQFSIRAFIPLLIKIFVFHLGNKDKEALAALESLTPLERLFHDIQTAFEDNNIPMVEYSTLDAGKLARLLPIPLVAKSTRLFLEKTKPRWSRRWADGKQISLPFHYKILVSLHGGYKNSNAEANLGTPFLREFHHSDSSQSLGKSMTEPR